MLVVTVVLALLPLTVLGAQVPLTNHWNGGFQGNACFDVTEDWSSWKITLSFDQPVNTLEVWVADVESVNADKTVYVLSSKSYNAAEHPGDHFCVGFLGHGNGDIVPNITATIEGVPGQPDPNHHPNNQHQQNNQVTTTLPPGVTRPSTTPIPIPDGDGPSATMELRNDWGDRFEGWFDFDFPEAVEGWIMKIHFGAPVSDVKPSQARIISHSADGTEWILANDDNTLYLQPGSHFQLRTVNTLVTPGPAPQASAVIINLGHDNWTVPEQPSSCSAKYNYDDVLMKSILFYEAQRSGKLPDDNRIPWRGDSALDDHGDNGLDLSGGWYDAGDYVKFNFPMAWATVVLQWGFLQFRDAYDSAGQTDWMYKSVKWPLDYLLKCYVPGDPNSSDDDVLYGQVGDGGIDHGSWGRPEDMTMSRPAFKVTATRPGSDLAMETAAAFAAGYLVFKDTNSSYADLLLERAKQLWAFGNQHQGVYSRVIPANGYYDSVNVTDENCWGSLWLYKATGEQMYLDAAKQWYDPSPDWGMSWDDVLIGNQILMYNLTGDEQYKTPILNTFREWFPGGSVPYTPKGLAFRLQWGSLRYASNMAMAALIAADMGVNSDELRHWALCQIHYALGDTGRSFVVGFGENPPVAPHHRSSSCPIPPGLCNLNIVHLDTPNVHTLYGALVGGPGSNDDYTDSRGNYVNNEVANDYNAGFQTAVAGLLHLCLEGNLPDATCPYS